jgi:alpha-amylase/alpha-mannosidase (GH57 family)
MPAKKRFVCIHCHFYQPPRENPWLEAIEQQESAYPYHDWNERISAECYGPNGLSRIMDSEGAVTRLVNNYSKISFNFGPTLLSWLENKAPDIYEAVLEGDRLSLERYDGHGSAIAQVYNHIIMPLANRQDKETQVVWGLRDFERRFGRNPESMWLAETAADTETLEVLSDYGIKYVILAPRQAKAVRPLKKDGPWREIVNEDVDPKIPYLCTLPSGRTITLFFYDGPISKGVAFEGLLHNGEKLANRLISGFDDKVKGSQLVHIATDGETYGHHHRNGDMALAYALDYLEQSDQATVTNYGRFLADHPPTMEAQIHDNSSWSCVHGIERWRSDCGCNGGGYAHWNQQWRAPLREAFDMLRDRLNDAYVKYMAKLTDKDPWAIRDDYVNVIMSRSEPNRRKFIKAWVKDGDNFFKSHPEEHLWKALEVQRQLQMIYTSCAWFFDEISGIETVQNLKYASRALELGRDVFGYDLEDEFLTLLEKAPCNLPEMDTGRDVYEQYVKPAYVDFLKAAAHFAVMALFSKKEATGEIYCYDFKTHDFERSYAGKTQLLIADMQIISRVTLESERIEFCVVHLGDHNINVGVKNFESDDHYKEMKGEFVEAFDRGDLAQTVRLLEKYFQDSLFSLKDLFKDQQKEAISVILDQSLKAIDSQFSDLYRQHYPIMCYLSDLRVGFPSLFQHIAEYVQNSQVKKALSQPEISTDMIQENVEEARNWDMPLDQHGIQKSYIEALERLFEHCIQKPADLAGLRNFYALVSAITHIPFDIEIGPIQNKFYLWYYREKENQFATRKSWRELTADIAGILRIRLPEQDGDGSE